MEIGPGHGAMTRLISARIKKLYAIELDRALSDALSQLFRDDSRVAIIQGDFLKYDLSGIPIPPQQKLKIIGNIPYYIASPIIEHILFYRSIVSSAYLTVQKEFGQRIVATFGSKHYGAFSCFVQYYAQPRIEFFIKRGCFFPVPKVDSCLLKIEIRPQPLVRVSDEGLLFSVIRTSFQQRRKQMKSCLKGMIRDEKLDRVFSLTGIDPRIRPEELSILDFARLSEQILCEGR